MWALWICVTSAMWLFMVAEALTAGQLKSIRDYAYRGTS